MCGVRHEPGDVCTRYARYFHRPQIAFGLCPLESLAQSGVQHQDGTFALLSLYQEEKSCCHLQLMPTHEAMRVGSTSEPLTVCSQPLLLMQSAKADFSTWATVNSLAAWCSKPLLSSPSFIVDTCNCMACCQRHVSTSAGSRFAGFPGQQQRRRRQRQQQVPHLQQEISTEFGTREVSTG